MKNIRLMTLLLCFIIACSSKKNDSSTQRNDNGSGVMKEAALEGTWEADYIMNTPKNFREQNNDIAPSITFNVKEMRISGLTGCNNFSGTYSVDGAQLKISDKLAVTRKMCPDMSVEDAFLKTLQKVNKYSLSNNGNTLNLIMGDTGVMRLQRK